MGEINYLDWKSKFQCSKQEQQNHDLLSSINECCENMEKDLKQWKQTIDEKRLHYYSLNHFTMKQILTLRKELAKACVGETAVNELPWQIFVLLQTVKNDIDPIILANVLKSMIPENSVYLKDEENLENANEHFDSDEDRDGDTDSENDTASHAHIRRQNSFEVLTSVKDILESQGYDEEYILAALQVCGREATKDDLLAWVFDCNDDEENILALSQEAKQNPRLSDLITEVFGTDSDTGGEDNLLEISEPTR